MRVIPGLKDGATIAEALRMMAQSFRLAGIDTPEVDARLLLAHALRVDRARLIAEADRLLESREIASISALAARRLKREPVARIFGTKEFWSLPLSISEAVLVPRPETETVVELALDLVGDRRQERLRVLDIGTGSGALLLALLSELPNAAGIGTDISAAALEIARGNAERNGLAARCSFVVSNIAAGVSGAFDLIVSNPPYVAHGDIASLAPEVRAYDPALALDGGNDGLDAYRAIAQDAPHLLAPGGHLVVELGAGQQTSVSALFTKAALKVGPVRNDLAAIPRALSASIGPNTAI